MVLYKCIVLGLIFLIVGFGIGYMIGYSSALKWVSKKAVAFLKQGGIEFDAEHLNYILNQYKSHIDTCYPG